uniref:Uncharacterized protein n=1 Tax=Aegilops tauschii subsp. strangulata TaxID=200361 RepID=A0A453E8F0_AEGTS
MALSLFFRPVCRSASLTTVSSNNPVQYFSYGVACPMLCPATQTYFAGMINHFIT